MTKRRSPRVSMLAVAFAVACGQNDKASGSAAAGSSGNAVGGAASSATGCVAGQQRSCDQGGVDGSCAAGTQTCQTDGVWSSCSIQPAASDGCEAGNDDDCDGTPNEGCPCVDGQTQACGSTPEVGRCHAGESLCTDGAWGACQGVVYPAARDCSSADDNDCDGVADDDEGCEATGGAGGARGTTGGTGGLENTGGVVGGAAGTSAGGVATGGGGAGGTTGGAGGLENTGGVVGGAAGTSAGGGAGTGGSGDACPTPAGSDVTVENIAPPGFQCPGAYAQSQLVTSEEQLQALVAGCWGYGPLDDSGVDYTQNAVFAVVVHERPYPTLGYVVDTGSTIRVGVTSSPLCGGAAPGSGVLLLVMAPPTLPVEVDNCTYGTCT